jgi:Ca2+-binding EF-hand superfamily protein
LLNSKKKNIKKNYTLFYRYDVNNDKKLDLEELKVMMEKLQIPQTHLGLKEMIRQVDDDQDNKINFKEVKK